MTNNFRTIFENYHSKDSSFIADTRPLIARGPIIGTRKIHIPIIICDGVYAAQLIAGYIQRIV